MRLFLPGTVGGAPLRSAHRLATTAPGGHREKFGFIRIAGPLFFPITVTKDGAKTRIGSVRLNTWIVCFKKKSTFFFLNCQICGLGGGGGWGGCYRQSSDQ